MLASHIDDLLQHLARIQRASGVVGVDNDDGLRARRDLALDIVDIVIPLSLLVADVVNGRAAGKGGASRPQRIVGAGDKDLVAGVEQRLHAQVNELADAVAGVDAVHVYIGKALDLRVLHDGLARAEQALRIAVALAIGKLVAHVLNNFIGRAEAERGRVADVQFQNAHALGLHASCFVHNRTTNIVQNVIKLRGFLELTHRYAPLIIRLDRFIIVGRFKIVSNLMNEWFRFRRFMFRRSHGRRFLTTQPLRSDVQ